MLLRLFRLWRIQWWTSFLFFFDRKYLFLGKLFQEINAVCWNKKLEPRLIRIFDSWYQDYFEHVKFDCDVHFFCFRPYFPSFVQKIHLAFWCYMISFAPVYSQRYEASGFSCFKLIWNENVKYTYIVHVSLIYQNRKKRIHRCIGPCQTSMKLLFLKIINVF